MTVAFTDLEDLFCILHDGRIARASWDGRDLLLDVKIRYLAQRLNPRFLGFAVRLHAVEELLFSTWPAAGSAPDRLVNVDAIFKADLEVLSGSVIGHR